MANWFRNLFGATPMDRDEKRRQQNDWIKQQFAEWQLAWHDAFDRDAALSATDEFERPDPLPDDVGLDHRLIFGLAHATPETRRTCFAPFPNGARMRQRFEAFLAAPRASLTQEQALGLVADVARHMGAARPNEDVDWSRIRVVHADDPGAREILARTNGLPYLFERSVLDPHPDKELPAIAAMLFLTEPLYASAGNYYELHDWVTAAMFDPDRDRVHELSYRLWHAGWRLRLADEGVVLACERSAD